MERRLTHETNSILPFQMLTSSQPKIKEQRISAKNTQLTKRKGGATDFLDQNKRREETSKMGHREDAKESRQNQRNVEAGRRNTEEEGDAATIQGDVATDKILDARKKAAKKEEKFVVKEKGAGEEAGQVIQNVSHVKTALNKM